MRRRLSGLFLFAFIGGAAAGTVVWSGVRHNYRRNLFSRRPVERFIALTYLSGQPTLETVRLLGDYVRWEKRPALRRHATRTLYRVERRLRESA